MTAASKGSITAGIVWMFLISILLFWLPVAGPFLAGLVGGKKAGGVGNALAAALLPAAVFAVAMFLLATVLTTMPLVGVVAAAGGFALALSHVGPLLLGAFVGGLLA
jgi:hypothetical protein